MKKEIRDAKQLVKKEKYIYQSANNAYPNAKYTATIINETKHTLTFRIKCIQSTIEEVFGDSIPYNVTVMKKDVGRTDHLFAL